MADKACLLFCETFLHDPSENMHLDMVGFAQSITISEVRVIPHGCKVHPDIRDRLGETTPSSFKLELFCKNLNKPNASVFERLGVLDYEEGKSIQLIVNSKTVTNVILVRGWYRNLTVSLYGNFTSFQPDITQVPPPPPMETRSIPAGIDSHLSPQVQPNIPQVIPSSALSQIPPGVQPVYIQTQGIDNQIPQVAIPPHMEHINFASPGYPGNRSPQEDFDRRSDRDSFNDFRRERWRQNDNTDRRHQDRFDDRRNRRDFFDRRNEDGFQNDNHGRYDDNKRRRDNSFQGGNFNEASSNRNQGAIPTEELFEPLSPESDFFDNSQDEPMQQGKEKGKSAQIGYEDIESDEDLMLEDFDFDERNLQNDFEADETWASLSLSFNPYQCSISPLETIPSLTETEFEKSVKEFKRKPEAKEPNQLKQLQDYIVSDSEAERDAKWVTMLEELPNIVPISMAYLRSQPSQKIKEKHFLSIISEWAIFGLNMDKACALPLAVNIRFLKAGLKLTCLLANACDEYQRLLIENDVQEKLIELLKTNHMASSLKLLILKALNITSNTAYGMENMLGWNLEASDERPTVYEVLLVYLLSQPTVRVITSLKALLQKAHFYENVSTLQSICGRISRSPVKIVSIEEDIKKELKDGDVIDQDEEKYTEKESIELDISNKDMSDILSSLENMYKIIDDGNNIISQPSIRAFPTTAKLQEEEAEDCYPAVFRLLTSRRFLESISILVSSPLFCEPPLFVAIRDLIFLLLSSYRGLVYLSSEPNTCNGLIRVLLQASESDMEFAEMPSLKQYIMSSDTADSCTPHQLGLLLVYHLQSFQGVDQLLATAKPDMDLVDMDSSDHISMLHYLYAMTFAPIGRDAVTNTFSEADNLKCLLPFLVGNEEFDSKMKKSVCCRYASLLLNLTLQHSDGVEYLKRFGSNLLTVPKKENDKTQEDIHNLLSPLEKVTKLDQTSIGSLLEFLKNELDDLKIGSGNIRSVLTSLRLLKYLARKDVKGENKQKDLQWQVSILNMFSANALETLVILLHKVGDQLLAPWKQNEPFTNNQCFILVNIAMLALEITDTLLTHALSTTYCFKDARLVQELFTLHKILCAKPPSGLLSSFLSKMQDLIIELLRKFMKGTVKAPESEEAVKSSTWYITFKELLTFAIVKPENFITGLVLLSELLPTPLPFYSLQDVKEEQVTKVMNHRMFAMANFSCLSTELKLLIKTVIGSCCSMMQYYLRRVTCQLVDLGPSIATSIIRSLCEMINDAIDTANKEAEDSATVANQEDGNTETDKKPFLPTNIFNTFSLLSYLVCQRAGKAALLSLLETTETSVTKFPDFISKIILVKDKETDVQYIEHSLLPLFQSVCDHEVCLKDFDGIITLRHLSNSLPSANNLKLIVEMLFGCLSMESLPLLVLIRAMNILETLTDHDYGMQIIKEYLSIKGECFFTFLVRLLKEAEKKTDVPNVYNAISTFIDFLNLLNSAGPESYMKSENGIKTEVEETDQIEKDSNDDSTDQMDIDLKRTSRTEPLQRSILISANMLKVLLKLDGKHTSDHELTKLEKLIEEEGKDDEELVSLSQAITTLRMIMIATGEFKDADTAVEAQIHLGQPESIQEMFNKRIPSVLINNADDGRATANDWFDAPAPDDIDSDSENDALKVDLIALAEKFLPNFKFVEEIEKGFVDTTERRSKRSKQAFIRRGDHIEDTKRLRFDVSALSTPPNMRGFGRGANRGLTRGFFGRGFNRGGRGFRGGFRRGRGRGNDDNFRQRRQNTSRPPSMHVDDFVNMEKTGETVMTHNKGEAASVAPTTNERFPNTYNSTSTGPQQNRWNNPQGSNFRRNNEGNATQPNQPRNNAGAYENHNRPHYGGNKFHNRSGSDWNASTYSQRGGSRDAYSRPQRGGGGGYWQGGGPKQKDDGRFYNNYRQNNRGRHQRTFTR